MNNNLSRATVILLLAGVVIIGLGLALTVTMSCTKTLDGNFKPNQQPIVYFVNIPPEGEQFSRNPVVYWVGTDRDGLISAFFYHVATAAEIGVGVDPMSYAQSLPESDWIRLDVDPKGPDPQTTNVVSMSANLTDPVRSFVDQYVFLKAIDEQDLESDIIYRLFSRNDNPPNTEIWPVARPSIDSDTTVGGIVTGVRLKFSASDPIDYPADPPPFEFQWRLYGPYSEAELATLNSDYFTSVCVTADGIVYQLGEDIIRCDTAFTDSGIVQTCDTLRCAEGMVIPEHLAHFVMVEDYFAVEDLPEELLRFGDISYDGDQTQWMPDCGRGASAYKCLAKDNLDTWFTDTMEATWVIQTSEVMEDTVFNVYWDYESDTTLAMNYVFWVRSRDDAKVPDLVPEYRTFSVISPQYERDVLVLDFQVSWLPWNQPDTSDGFRVKGYWKDALEAWAAQEPRLDGIVFDTTTLNIGHWQGRNSAADYIRAAMYDAGPPIAELLKHKVVILYNDCLTPVQAPLMQTVWTAIDAGVNAWATWRAPAVGGASNPPLLAVVPPREYNFYFGVERTAWSGWFCFAGPPGLGNCTPAGFYQDFVGTLSKYPETWPNLTIDPDLLRERYNWMAASFDLWENELGVGVVQNPGLPEVNWSQLRAGTKAIYKYKSSYGESHPLGAAFKFQGRPVGHIYYTSLFKTAYFNFTPLAMEPEAMQKVTNNVLTWLYFDGEPLPLDPGEASLEPVEITIEQARENVRAREAEYGDDWDRLLH
ncbi:MAG: hypothetical protein ABIE70_11445 [bacterium]